jgi:hypothetical protein
MIESMHGLPATSQAPLAYGNVETKPQRSSVRGLNRVLPGLFGE